MTCIVKYDLPHKGRYTDSIDHTWACVKIAQREQKLATRNHRQVLKINARKSSRLLRFIPVSSGHSILAPSVKKKGRLTLFKYILGMLLQYYTIDNKIKSLNHVKSFCLSRQTPCEEFSPLP